MESTILIVDDELDIVTMLQDYFELSGYRVLTALCGREAMEKAEKGPDLILLDINMPDMDGLEVCRKIRDFVACPIIFLTARIEEEDKIKGLKSGADDYVVKPFSIDELGARVEAHLRREQRHMGASQVKFDNDFVIDYSGRCVYYKGNDLGFVKKEFDIIEFLSQNRGQIFDKERIYDRIWGLEGQGDSSVIAEHVRRIRAKMADAGCRSYIETVWGVGYKWAK